MLCEAELLLFLYSSSVRDEKGERERGVGAVLETNPKEPEEMRGHQEMMAKVTMELHFYNGIFIFALFIVSGTQTAFYKLENAI